MKSKYNFDDPLLNLLWYSLDSVEKDGFAEIHLHDFQIKNLIEAKEKAEKYDELIKGK